MRLKVHPRGFMANTKPYRFLELVGGVDDNGCSRKVTVDELEAAGLGLDDNGWSGARNKTALGKTFKVERFTENGKVTAIQLAGYTVFGAMTASW